jgi:hypoxanthine phosphoribosyltransferase
MKKEINIHDKTFSIYIPESEIQNRVAAIAAEMNAKYKGQTPLIISVLNGAFMFTSDLMKLLDFPCELCFIRVSSYEGLESTGKLKQLIGLSEDPKGRHVILVEDIVDTGHTISALVEQISASNPESLSVCSLLVKPDRHETEVNITFSGFVIPDRFVVGYGLDLDGLGRNLPHIYQLKNN